MESLRFEMIWEMTEKIPRKKVASYGQIAILCGFPRAARLVGWALHACPEERLIALPWHRVVNKEGRLSTTCLDHTKDLQKWLLEKEGVKVKTIHGNFFIDLKKYQWRAGIV